MTPVRTEDGNDTVNASPTVATAATLPLWVYGGDGSDTITGGNGGDTIVPGSGQNVIHEGNGWNSPEIVDDSDGVRSGVNNSFQVSGSDWTSGPAGAGFNGSEQVHAKNGSGSPAATWSFANLPATGYYDVYVTWSREADASTAAQYVVRDGGGPLTPVGQASVATVNQSLPPADAGTMYPWSAAGVFWHDLGVFAATQGSTLTVKLEADPNATVLADAVRLVNDGATPPATNLTMNSFAVNAAGQLAVTYTITGADSPPFSIGIYQSADGVQPTNLVGTIDVTAPDLTGGGAQYTLTYAGDLSGLDDGQFYLARLDAYDQVTETTKADNLSAPLSGVFEDSDGSLYAVTGLDGNSHSLTFSQDAATGDLIVDLDGSAQAFQNAGTINVVAYQGTNSIDAAGVNMPMTIYGGDGSDAITGGDGGNTIYGGTAGGNVIYAGAGDDTIYGGGGAGGGHNAIYGGAGSDTIYAGDGGDAITGGTANDEIYGGAGNDTLSAGSGDNWIQAGSGNDTITGGPDQDWLIGGGGNDVIQGGSGNEVIEGGSGTDTLIGGGGLDNITGGSGTNFIYGNGQHDLLQGGSGLNYILPNPGSGLASMEVENGGNETSYGYYSNGGEASTDYTSDGNIDANGNDVQLDYDPGYGGVWNFHDFDSGVRLGESTVTPVAIYATWDPSDPDHELPRGDHWESDAVYTICGAADGTHVINDVDQTASPGNALPNDRPWRLLGVYDVNVGSTLTVTLGYDLPNGQVDADKWLCISDVMIQPLWPTVSIRATDVSVNGKVASANDGIYEDWFDACNPIEPPVEGQGDRVELQLQASMEQLYTQIPASMGDWHYVLPAVSGLDFWNGASGGTQLTGVDDPGDLVNDSYPSSGQYTRTVYVTLDPNGPLATDADDGSAVATALAAAPEADPTAAAGASASQPSGATISPTASMFNYFYPFMKKTTGENATVLSYAQIVPAQPGPASVNTGAIQGEAVNNTMDAKRTAAVNTQSQGSMLQVLIAPGTGFNAVANMLYPSGATFGLALFNGQSTRDKDSAQCALRWYDASGNVISLDSNEFPANHPTWAADWSTTGKVGRVSNVYCNFTIPTDAKKFSLVLVYTDILESPDTENGFVDAAGIGHGDLPDIMASWTGTLTNNVWSISQNWGDRFTLSGAFGWPPRGAPGGAAVTPWPTKKEISKGVAAVKALLVKETGWTLEERNAGGGKGYNTGFDLKEN